MIKGARAYRDRGIFTEFSDFTDCWPRIFIPRPAPRRLGAPPAWRGPRLSARADNSLGSRHRTAAEPQAFGGHGFPVVDELEPLGCRGDLRRGVFPGSLPGHPAPLGRKVAPVG